MRKQKDITGHRFGKLTAIKVNNKRGSGVYVWECVCDCGNTAMVAVGHLNSGNVRSCGCLRKLPDGEVQINYLYYKCGYDAVKRNYSFDLTKEQFKNIINQNCFYCGSFPEKTHARAPDPKGLWYPVNGIDRFDNTLGYTIENSVPCCGMCNRMKMAYSYGEFISQIDRIYRYRVERKDDKSNIDDQDV